MNVHHLAIANGVNPRCFDPLPLQIALDVEVQGSRYTVPMTQDWSGVAVVIDGKTLLRNLQSGGQSIPVDLRIAWEEDMLHFDHTGPFANLGALLIADDEGTTSIDVSILQREALDQGNIVAEESASTGSFRIFKVNLSLTESTGDVIVMDVGTNLVPRRGAIAGSSTHFDPALAFAGALSLRELSEKSCTLGQVRQPVSLPYERPMQMNYEWRDQPGPPSAARFEVPRIVRLTNAGAVQFGNGIFKIVHGRRPGTMNLTTTLTATDSRYDVPFGHNAFDVYQVNPYPLSFTLEPAPADNRNGKLLFEDRWIPLPDQPNGGRLVSAFRLEVKRGTETIYRSWEPAILEMALSPKNVFITALYIDDDQGIRTQLPFRLMLESSAETIVEFWQPTEDAGLSEVYRTLDDIMAAVGSGPCDIDVTIINFDEPIPLHIDKYEMPRPSNKTLHVEIPPPLEADLTVWEDDHFSGANALDLGEGSEVIYATGEISGRVRNRTGADSERITLKLTLPGGGSEDLGLTYGSGATLENFVSAVDGLRLGANQFELSAEKPINLVVNGGPSTDSATLTGVRPQSVTLTPMDGQQAGGTVVRRDVGRFAYGYSRATRAVLKEICASGTYDVATYGQAYPASSGNQNVTLRRETGNHTLRLVAENDFDTVSSADFTVTAPAPQFTPAFLTSNIPHDPFDPRHVGHSVSRVSLRISARFCLSYEVSHDGTSYRSIQPADPFVLSEDTHDAPGSPRDLNIGLNVFTFSFGNEFATGTLDRDVRRRDDVFDVGGTLAITLYDTTQEAILELVDIRPEGFGGMLPGPTSGIEIGFERTGLSNPIGFERMRWRVMDKDTEDDDVPETLDYRLTFSAESIGPDFERLASFMEIDPADLDEGDPDTIAAPISALSDVSGLDLSGPNRYWTRARIWGHTGELWIPLLTRAMTD